MASNAPSAIQDRGDTQPASTAPVSGIRRCEQLAPYIVLVGLDLSEPGGRAWRFAFDLAALKGEESEVHAVIVGARAMEPEVRDIVTPGVSTTKGADRDAAPLPPLKVLEHRSAGGKARLMAMHFRSGRPDKAIVQLAREIGADVIVVATQPTTGLARLLGGSVADRIARNAPCPVVVVRPKVDEDDPGLAEFPPRRA
jgi:nucleotide-binding universal stress UspA family protein